MLLGVLLLVLACADESETPTATTATETPTSGLSLNVTTGGLACYGKLVDDWISDFGDLDEIAGLPSMDEAATDWWLNSSDAQWWRRWDGTPLISAEDLTQFPAEGDAVAFRDAEGNAQIVIFGLRLGNGTWIIDRGESCYYER